MISVLRGHHKVEVPRIDCSDLRCLDEDIERCSSRSKCPQSGPNIICSTAVLTATDPYLLSCGSSTPAVAVTAVDQHFREFGSSICTRSERAKARVPSIGDHLLMAHLS